MLAERLSAGLPRKNMFDRSSVETSELCIRTETSDGYDPDVVVVPSVMSV